MANVGTSIRAKPTDSRTPTIYNEIISTANVEQSLALSSNTKKLTIKARSGSAKLRLAFASGETSTGDYITIHPGVSYAEDGLDFTGSIYFQSNVAPVTIEVLEWT